MQAATLSFKACRSSLSTCYFWVHSWSWSRRVLTKRRRLHTELLAVKTVKLQSLEKWTCYFGVLYEYVDLRLGSSDGLWLVQEGSRWHNSQDLAVGNLRALQNMDERDEGESGTGNTSPGHVTVICKEFLGGGEVNMMSLWTEPSINLRCFIAGVKISA